MSDDNENTMTQKLRPDQVRRSNSDSLPKTPPPGSAADTLTPIAIKYRRMAPVSPRQVSRQDLPKVRQIEEECRRFCLSLFFREKKPIRSLGITSAVPGEGKSFVAAITAQVLAADSLTPVTLVECNWDHPTLHELYGFSAVPGLAEWIRGECVEGDIRYPVAENLNVIPAGDGHHDAVRILQRLKQRGILATLAGHNGLLVADLPSLTTSSYSILAANLLDTVAIVARIGVTTEQMLQHVSSELNKIEVAGIILNRVTTKERL